MSMQGSSTLLLCILLTLIEIKHMHTRLLDD